MKCIYIRKENYLLNWPIDLSVDLVRYLFISVLKYYCGEPIAYIGFWPKDADFALLITHDIDSDECAENITKFLDFEQKKEIPSTIFTVSELKNLKLIDNIFKRYKKKTIEISSHGYDHSHSLLFDSEEKFSKKMESIINKLEHFNIVGFRSPVLLRNREILEKLKPYFDYDSSFPTTDLNLNGICGCGTVFPYINDNIVEIPISIPMDFVYIMLKCEEQRIIEEFEKLLARIKRISGCAVFIFHSNNHLSIREKYFKVFKRIINKIKQNSDDIYLTTCRDLVENWIRRSQLSISYKDNEFFISHPKTNNIQEFRVCFF